MKCRVVVCEREAKVREMCWAHYNRFRRYGHPQGKPERASQLSKAMARTVRPEIGCWLYDSVATSREPRLKVDGRTIPVARFFYEVMIDPVPEGARFARTCDTLNCVRPDHWRVLDPKDVAA